MSPNKSIRFAIMLRMQSSLRRRSSYYCHRHPTSTSRLGHVWRLCPGRWCGNYRSRNGKGERFSWSTARRSYHGCGTHCVTTPWTSYSSSFFARNRKAQTRYSLKSAQALRLLLGPSNFRYTGSHGCGS